MPSTSLAEDRISTQSSHNKSSNSSRVKNEKDMEGVRASTLVPPAGGGGRRRGGGGGGDREKKKRRRWWCGVNRQLYSHHPLHLPRHLTRSHPGLWRCRGDAKSRVRSRRWNSSSHGEVTREWKKGAWKGDPSRSRSNTWLAHPHHQLHTSPS